MISLYKLQLVTTVQDAIGDVEGLHSKLDRKRHVESSNQATHMKYQQGFHSEVSSMMADLEGFASSQQQTYNNFSNRIGEYRYVYNSCLLFHVHYHFRGVGNSSEWRIAGYQTSRWCTDCVCEPVYGAATRHSQGIQIHYYHYSKFYDASIMQHNLANSQDSISDIQSTVQIFKVCWTATVYDG